MSTKQAPPLGNLTRDTATTPDTPLPAPKLPTAKEQGSGKEQAPVKELVFSQPGIPDTMDFSKVGGNAGRALSEYVPPDQQPIPMLKSINSRPEMPVSDRQLNQLAGNESTPFDYTGFGAGTVGREQIQLDPTSGMARHDSNIGKFIDNPLNFTGSSDVVIANSRPVQSFGYTEGLTQSQRNSREFFNGLQEFRQTIQPHMLPALQFTPQQLNPGVAGGFSPTAETKGPFSWFVDGPQKNINPIAGEFGASGGGFLGGVGWVFGRLSPMTYLKGASLDVSRSAAALYEGGSSALTELFKSGDFGKAMSQGGSAMEENYYSNAPQARGVYTQTFGGSREVGDELSQSYFLAALSGMTDMPFSGVGNKEGASRNVVLDGDNFNPFGVRDPFRSGFKTGALENKERQQGAWFGHGYDQWATGGAGLILGDILLEGRVDKLALGALSKAISGSKAVTKPATTVAQRVSQEAIEALRTSEARNRGTMVHVPTAKLPSPGVRVSPDITAFITPPTRKGGQLVPTAKQDRGITQVVQGEILPDNASAIVLRRNRQAPTYNSPIANRYLPSGSDPFAATSSRVYVPEAGNGLDITPTPGGTGAIVPYQGNRSQMVPAVLGVGGKPGGIPANPRVQDGRVFIADGTIPPVTVWDETTKSFVTTGAPSTTVKRVLHAPGTAVVDDIIEGTIVSTNRPVEVPATPVGRNTPEAPVTRPQELLSGLSGDVTTPTPRGNSAVLRAEDDVLIKATNHEPPPLVPRNTPNFTVQPSALTDSTIRESHVVDEATGVFVNATERGAVASRKAPQSTGDRTPHVTIPVREVEYVTAEAISPSLNGADIVRRLTSGDDLAGATYNPRHVERQQRSIASVVSLARQVTLPNGVRILSDGIQDVSVMKFSRLQKKVDAAIIASGLNPSSTEAAGIRRLFDRTGKPLPTNLSPDFSIEVATRTVTSPSSYVKPATQVSEGGTTWTGRAARYTPQYDLSSEYAIGVKVKYDDDLKRIVPVDGQDMKLMPPVRTEPSKGMSTQVINREQLRSLSVPERQAVLSKSFKDGYEVPQGAIDDVMTPDIKVDAVAAKDYAKANLPKDSVPIRMDRDARTALATHQELVEEVSYTGNLITDVSTQLTDVERTLSTYLKQVDELPDIGIETLVDDVPFSSLIKREMVRTKLLDVETINTGSTLPPVDNVVPVVLSKSFDEYELVGGNLAVGNPRPGVVIVDSTQLPYAQRQLDAFRDDFAGTVHDGNTLSSILDLDNIKVMGTPTDTVPTAKLQELFERGAFLTPVVRMSGVDEYTVVSGTKYVSAYRSAVTASGDTLVDRMAVIILRPENATGSTIGAPVLGVDLYHGTRVSDLVVGSINPLEGAARSEYGTGVWLTNKQDVAMAASGRGVPDNSVPNVNRTIGDTAYVHEIDGASLQNLRIVNAQDVPTAKIINDLLTQLDNNRYVFSDVIPYGDDLLDEVINLLESGKVTNYGDLFGQVDELTFTTAKRNLSIKPDEYELTYVQRVLTDMLQSSGIQGITNGVNTAVYDTRGIATKFIHDVTDIAGDASDDVTSALHNVNLLQESLRVQPTSKLLQVQLAEAKAVAASKIRDSLSDELDTLNKLQSQQTSKLMDQDDVLSELSRTQKAEGLIRASTKDDNMYDSFSKELNRDWTGPCL
jgi:hypothetical protein